MGLGRNESPSFFIVDKFTTMMAALTPWEYVTSGPGCLAPYLYYKGMLQLNYKKNRTLAGEYFDYAAQLFEHEVREFKLIQYEPWLSVTRDHTRIAGRNLKRRVQEDPNVCKETRDIQAVPFLREGVFEFCNNVPIGNLLRISLKGGDSYVFKFKCMENNLSGMSFDVLLKPFIKATSVKLTLDVFEEYNPVAERRASIIVGFDYIKTSRPKLQRFSDPFRFKPISDSRGKTYSIVLGIPYYIDHMRCWTQFPGRESPLVSCIIVTFNSENYIHNCLESISRQDYPNIEVVVIDNHSKDRTADIVREEFSYVKYFEMDNNLGYCGGNNFGLSKCKGKFICILNHDIVLEREAIRRFVEHIDVSSDIAIVGSTIETKGSVTRYADTFIINGVISSSEKFLVDERFSSAPCGAGFLIRRSAIDDLGYLFDKDFISNWEDHDLGLRCWLNGYFVLHIPKLGLYHYGGGAYGLAEPRRDSQIFRNTLLTYFKNFGFRLFFKAFFKTILICTRPYRVLGVIRFLGVFWKFIPKRIALQKKRRIDDSVLQVLTSGSFSVFLHENKGKEESYGVNRTLHASSGGNAPDYQDM
jgi:GT2 family glycosyltransferase